MDKIVVSAHSAYSQTFRRLFYPGHADVFQGDIGSHSPDMVTVSSDVRIVLGKQGVVSRRAISRKKHVRLFSCSDNVAYTVEKQKQIGGYARDLTSIMTSEEMVELPAR
jgi:hypothetical protein